MTQLEKNKQGKMLDLILSFSLKKVALVKYLRNGSVLVGHDYAINYERKFPPRF